jgi:hypothetical protein
VRFLHGPRPLGAQILFEERGAMVRVVIRRVRPVYPDLASMAGVEGTVIVEALVGMDGRV